MHIRALNRQTIAILEDNTGWCNSLWQPFSVVSQQPITSVSVGQGSLLAAKWCCKTAVSEVDCSQLTVVFHIVRTVAFLWLSYSQPAWASYQIRKIAGCACAGNAGNVFPRRRFQRKPLVSDPGMHHGTCVTHVPWCMSGSLTCGDGENVPGIPGACAPAILRIWQEAHGVVTGIVKQFQQHVQWQWPA